MKYYFTLDRRRARRDERYPIKLYLYHRGQCYIPTKFAATIEEWDAEAGVFRVKQPADKLKNFHLRDMLNKIEGVVFGLELAGEIDRMTISQVRDAIEASLGSRKAERRLLVAYFDKGSAGKSERTRALWKWSKGVVEEFDGKIQVADVSKKWLAEFQAYVEGKGYSPNTVSLLLSYVARACSIAYADGVIRANPAVGYKKPRQDTRKRSLSVAAMRKLRDMELEGADAWARDMFFLSFYLIGMNMADLYDLKAVRDGRVEYARRKTGTLYSVAVTPEAAAILEQWKGDGRLVYTRSYRTAGTMCTDINRRLAKMHPGLSTYYARHTWATMAAELDIPIETISHALGHKIGSPVTAIYVAYNQRKIDEANRRVIDYLNKDKKD